MTVMPVLSDAKGTPIEGITAPARAPDPTTPARPAIPAETFVPGDDTPYHASRRHDGWSAANQRLFLEAIAEGHGVDAATQRVGLSAASAYAFRRTAKGAAFALGWRAAGLVARDTIAETLLVRALEGQVDTVVRADGTTVTRHRHDNRLAMSLLARLDRQVESAADADVRAARLVAQEFDAFLDLVARDDGPARAGLFLARAAGAAAELTPGSVPDRPAAPADATGPAALAAPAVATLLAPIYALAAADRLVRTGVASAAEVDVADLDPAARAAWTGEQWLRAEAAGMVALACPPDPAPASAPAETSPASQHSQHSADEDAPIDVADHVWWDEQTEEWRTHLPPADDFDAEEYGVFGRVDYTRALSEAEAAAMGPGPDVYDDDELAELARLRDLIFGCDAAGVPADTAVGDAGGPPDPATAPGIAPPDEDGDAAERPANATVHG